MSAVRYFVIFTCTLICLFAIIGGGAYLGHTYLEKWGQQRVSLSAAKEIELKRGMSLTTLSKELHQQSLVSSDQLFEWWVKLFSSYATFQAGRYRFEKAIAPKEIASAMQNGETYEPVLFTLSIPEGFTMHQIAERAESIGICPTEDFLQYAMDPYFVHSLEISAPTLEGYLFPATYRFTKHPSALELIIELTNTFKSAIPTDYEQQLKEKGLSLHQGVTFASLIERETQRDDERSKVSEVIWNRYSRGIALAIDASIIYGIKDFDGNLRRRHLKDRENPYNTRIHRGLPPGPIGSPALASLMAVLDPTSEGYFYYVVDADNFSQHRFAHTLREHNRNVAAYVRARKEQ